MQWEYRDNPCSVGENHILTISLSCPLETLLIDLELVIVIYLFAPRVRHNSFGRIYDKDLKRSLEIHTARHK